MPKLLSGSGEIDGLTDFEGAGEGFGVHVGKHEDLAGFVVLGDGGDEAVFVELGGEGEALFKFLF